MLQNLAKALYPSETVTFDTHRTLADAVARLRNNVTKPSILTALTFVPQQCAVGSVNPDRVRIERVRMLVANGPKPVFYGRFEERENHLALVGSFEPSVSSKAFLTVWFGFLGLWTLLSLVSLIKVFERPSDLLFPICGIAMFFAGLGFVRLGWWIGSSDRHYICDVVKDALG